ncbi:MBG domain-containing protein [Pediococcus damnosus]|uniref:MBG domain-containing protein n=1 Tax=Pediococcus damnosus TaxID=51663 RepID=UPI0013040DA6|nr:MBG domain-containing protein [Pediococcus damnosus]
MNNRQRKLKRLKLLQDTGQAKEHFKMYKVRKSWLFAGITVLFFGTGVFFGHPTAYAATEADTSSKTPITEVASSSSSSESSGSESAASDGTKSSETDAVTSSSNDKSSSNASSAATSTDRTALASSSTAQKTGSSATSSATSSNGSSAASSSVVSDQNKSSNVTSSVATSSKNSSAETTSSKASDVVTKEAVPSYRTASVKSLVTDAVAPSATEKAVDPVNTGSLDGTNPAGANAATSNLTADDIPDSFETTGAAAITSTPGTITLTNGKEQNGSYVFDNQVDTSQKFTLTGSYSSTAYNGTGGGLGIIIQPVDPQNAGNNSNTTADVGIDGLKSTTFVGRDFYVDSSKNDTTWNHLTIRQTDANGNMVLTPLANVTPGANQTAAVTKGEYYVLTWTPTSVDETTGTVTGTLNYTSYLDAAHTTSVQSTGNVVTTLSRAVSLAAFGATGGTAGTQTATVTAFTGTRVTMPVVVHYVDQSGAPISTDNTITVNVGSTFGAGANTLDSNTATSGIYQAKAIDGYTFGAATDPVTVVNTNIDTSATNEITVTYLKNAGTQTVSYDNVPTGATGNFSTQTQQATEASTIDATKETAKGYDAVNVTQIPGYTSMVSINGATAAAMTTIPAVAAGAADETDVVTYVANQASITVNYVDYFGNPIKTGTTTFTGNYGDVDNLTTNATTAVAIDGYTLGATDAVNVPATKVSFILDADGNVIATDASGNPVTSITLTYKTNVTASVSGTRVYDGLDGQDNGATSEQDDYKNLTFVLTDSKGNVLVSNIDASDIENDAIYYKSADVGKYPGVVNVTGKNLALFKAANPQYDFLSVNSGDYTITAAPVTATVTSGGTATKVYDGTAISDYVPSVVFARTDGGTLTPNEGTNLLDQIPAWTSADFTYSLNGKTVANPTDVGIYKIEFSDAGLAKLAAAKNFAITPVYLGTYTIAAANATATLSTPSFAYDGTNASAETGLFATVSVTAGTGDDGGSTVMVALTSNDVTFATDGMDAATYDYSLTAAGLATVQNAVKNYTLTNDNVTSGSVTIDKANATITVDDDAFDYDGASHSIPDGKVNITGAVGDEQLGYSLTNNSRTEAGSQTVGIALTAGDAVNANYNITATDTAQLTITPASTTGNEDASVTTDSKTITYGDDEPTFSITVGKDLTTDGAGLTNDDYTITNPKYTNDGKYLAAGNYAVVLNQSGIDKLNNVNGNYKIDSVTAGTITVKPKQIDVTAGSDSKVYGTKDPTLSSSYDKTQLVGTDTDLDYTVSRQTGEDVGSYFETITVGNNANHVIVPTAGRFTITPASTTGNENASVTTDSKTITYGDDEPTFSITVGKDLTTDGAGLTNDDYTITNPKYTNDGKYLAAGNYAVVLNQSGIDKLNNVNGNYKIDSVTAGTITVKPKQIDVTAGSDSKVYGTKDPTLRSSYDKTQLVGTDTDLDYTVGRQAGEDVGSYFETITVGNNANYVIVPTAGRFMITQAPTDPADANTKVTANDANSNYGDQIAEGFFTAKYGNKVKDAGLTNSDFSFTDQNGKAITGIPTNVGDYVISINAAGQQKIKNANPGYIFSADDFIAGTYTISAKDTTPGDADTTVKVNDASSSYGDSAPKFNITVGSDLKNPGNSTNNDFVFINKATGEVVKGVPSDVGDYQISLNDSGKAKVAAANPNYKFNDDSFISGTYTINDVVTHSEVTVNRTVHYTGAGKRTPGNIIQTITYDVATSKATGESVYTPQGSYAAVKTPTIAGFTNSGNVSGVTPVTSTTKPIDSTVTVTYTPINDIAYSEITITRTVHYEGAGSQTPKDVVEKVVYKVVTNKTTGEVSYTPQGVYDAVSTPTLTGYTNSGDVSELIPTATMSKPENSLVVVQYKKTGEGGNPSNPGNGGNNPGNPSNPGNGGNNNPGNPSNPGNGGNNHKPSNPGNSGITPGTGSNSGTGNSNGSGNETVQNNVKNSTGSKVKLEALQNSNVKGEAKKNVTANKAGTLPQTDEQHENVASLIGMVLLGGSMALFGIKRRKHDDE